MDAYQWTSSLISVAAIIIAAISLFKSYSSARQTTMNSINGNITLERSKLEDHIALMSQLTSKSSRTLEESNQLETYNGLFDSKIESLLNAYDDACYQYLHNKVSKRDFRNKYVHSIREMVEQNEEKFKDPITRFKSMVKVYKQWN